VGDVALGGVFVGATGSFLVFELFLPEPARAIGQGRGAAAHLGALGGCFPRFGRFFPSLFLLASFGERFCRQGMLWSRLERLAQKLEGGFRIVRREKLGRSDSRARALARSCQKLCQPL